MGKKPEQLDNVGLDAKLTEALVSWPLYRELRYQGSVKNVLPERISRSCTQCEKETRWAIVGSRAQLGTDKSNNLLRSYRCMNCKEQTVFFVFNWSDLRETIDGKQEVVTGFQKYGNSSRHLKRPSVRLCNGLLRTAMI
jgi:hypothetical protein